MGLLCAVKPNYSPLVQFLPLPSCSNQQWYGWRESIVQKRRDLNNSFTSDRSLGTKQALNGNGTLHARQRNRVFTGLKRIPSSFSMPFDPWSDEEPISLPFDTTTFQHVMKYMYTNELPSLEDVEATQSVFLAADLLKLHKLQHAAELRLASLLDSESVMGLSKFAVVNHCHVLLEECVALVVQTRPSTIPQRRTIGTSTWPISVSLPNSATLLSGMYRVLSR